MLHRVNTLTTHNAIEWQDTSGSIAAIKNLRLNPLIGEVPEKCILNKRMVYSKQGDVFASVVTGHNSRNVTVLEGNWFNNDAPAQRVSHRFSSQM